MGIGTGAAAALKACDVLLELGKATALPAPPPVEQFMRKSYIFRAGRLVDKRTGEALPDSNQPIGSPQLARDYGAYESPVHHGVMVEGRAAHREDLKRSGCRVMEKGEWNPVYRNADFARKRGLRLEGE